MSDAFKTAREIVETVSQKNGNMVSINGNFSNIRPPLNWLIMVFSTFLSGRKDKALEREDLEQFAMRL